MDTVTIGAKGISVSLDLTVGHIAAMEVEAGGRRLAPLHRAPWVGAPRGTLPENLPEGTVRLSGDFLCAPFSSNRASASGTWSRFQAISPGRRARTEPLSSFRRAVPWGIAPINWWGVTRARWSWNAPAMATCPS